MYRIDFVEYEPDGIHIRKILNSFSKERMADAIYLYSIFENAALYSDGRLLDKKSELFNRRQIKQFYCDLAADMIQWPHTSYDGLLKKGIISREFDNSFDVLINTILIKELDLKDPSILKPATSELINFLMKEKGDQP